jgi:hypothetical protein
VFGLEISSAFKAFRPVCCGNRVSATTVFDVLVVRKDFAMAKSTENPIILANISTSIRTIHSMWKEV